MSRFFLGVWELGLFVHWLLAFGDWLLAFGRGGRLGSFRVFGVGLAEIGFVSHFWLLGLWDWVRFV